MIPWYWALLSGLGFILWSIFMILVGAAIMKSSYSPPNDLRSLDR